LKPSLRQQPVLTSTRVVHRCVYANQENINLHKDKTRVIQSYPDLSRFIQIYPDLSRLVQICPDLSRFVQIYPDKDMTS
jgi:hypothetical protein